jgi:hypothetical protein
VGLFTVNLDQKDRDLVNRVIMLATEIKDLLVQLSQDELVIRINKEPRLLQK